MTGIISGAGAGAGAYMGAGAGAYMGAGAGACAKAGKAAPKIDATAVVEMRESLVRVMVGFLLSVDGMS
jgi:hypothetical protein